jgi:ABC-2 type transport system permease protein
MTVADPSLTPQPKPPSSGFGKVAAVAWREFKYTALTRAFLFGAVIVPVLVWGVIGLMPLMMRSEPPPLEGTIAIVDPSGAVVREAERQFRELAAKPRETGAIAAVGAAARGDMDAVAAASDGFRTVDIKVTASTDPADAEGFRERVRRNELLGVAVIDPKLLTTDPGNTTLELLVPTSSSPRHTGIYERILRDATVRARVAAAGDDYAKLSQILKRPDMGTKRVSREGQAVGESKEARMFIPFAFMMLLWISTFTSGNYLLTTTIEEKSNKVMEVLLSAVSPMQLLGGKILGQALVSAIMLVLYGGAAFAGLAALAMFDLVSPALVAYLLVFYVMAYFMVASIMAAVGSAVSDLREAQSLIGPAMLILMVPLILWLPISDNPNGLLATVTSFVPPLTPFVMILRLSGSAEPVPAWQVAASIVWGFAMTWAMIWMASRVFRVGILMQGKPPSPMELLKWVRYS